MSATPLISIITVTYNAGETLLRTIQSVDSQDEKCYEHIVVDGASKDGTLKILKDTAAPWRRVVSEPDKGIYDGMNKGLGLARGKYVMFLNAGDKFHSSHTLHEYAEAIRDNSDPGILYGQTDLVDDKGRYLAPRHLTAPDHLTYNDFRYGMLVCHQAMCVLRVIAPLYDLGYRYSADYDWCIQCLQHSRNNVYLGVTTIDYLSEGMTTKHRGASLRERFHIMSRYYGFFPTLWRHLGFVSRFFKHKRRMEKATAENNNSDPADPD